MFNIIKEIGRGGVIGMTEKRFKLTNPENKFCDMNCGINDKNKILTFTEVVEQLNEFHDENQSLKFQLDECRNNKLFSRRQLEKENEQLKQQIKDLRLNVLDSIHKSDKIQCCCNPCVVEECVKKVVE